MSRGAGRWEASIIAALERVPFFNLTDVFCDAVLGRPLTWSEYVAVHRAARSLGRKGRCIVMLLWSEGADRRLVTCLARPGSRMPDGRPLEEVSVKRVTNGTRSTYKGSLRYVAAQLGPSFSRTTVWRGLHAREGGG